MQAEIQPRLISFWIAGRHQDESDYRLDPRVSHSRRTFAETLVNDDRTLVADREKMKSARKIIHDPVNPFSHWKKPFLIARLTMRGALSHWKITHLIQIRKKTK
jgi:hypothetical protein